MKLLLYIALFFFQFVSANTIMLPVEIDSYMTINDIIKKYNYPFIKPSGVGLFECDNRLDYIIEEANLEQYKNKKSMSGLEFMYVLSQDHRTALNRKEFAYAQKISCEMKDILCGKYGCTKVLINDNTQYKKSVADKFRWIEQIQLSLGNVQENVFEFITSAELDNDLRVYADLARHLTLTPIFFQIYSHDMLQIMNSNGINEKKYLSLLRVSTPKLQKKRDIGNTIVRNLLLRHAGKNVNITYALNAKKESYSAYLDYVFSILQKANMNEYRCVDRGQTSSVSYNTCMFNSSFFNECQKGIIQSSKQGCLNKAKEYVERSINSMKWVLPYEIYKDDFMYEEVRNAITRLERDNGADALYGVDGDVLPYTSQQDKKIFPGIFSNVSVVEAAKFMCMSNLALLSKTQIYPEYGKTLAGYYKSGFFGSEHFPITMVSYSTGHAQSLERV